MTKSTQTGCCKEQRSFEKSAKNAKLLTAAFKQVLYKVFSEYFSDNTEKYLLWVWT